MTEPLRTRFPAIFRTVAQYYDDRLRRFGATPYGVDWNSAESQVLRFSKLLTVVDDDAAAHVIDYGCGYGALADYLRTWRTPVSYQGFDICEAMVQCARALHTADPLASFTADAAGLRPADFVVASGIFNVKLEQSVHDWRDYVLNTLKAMDALACRGFAFNMLSTCSDLEKRRQDLYYADPLETFDLCRRDFSPRVALLHDYPLYEFTILVRK
jgi:SAM-dependent methyltransferase